MSTELNLASKNLPLETEKPLLMVSVSETAMKAAPEAGLPGDIYQLPFIQTASYDMSVSMANKLNIPVLGSAAASISGRVIVLHESAFVKRDRKENEIEYVDHIGYTFRLVVSVDKWSGDVKATLPFIAASAELNQIKAEMLLQVIGLAGPKIDAAILPPTELNLETFVLAKQRLELLNKAKSDAETRFMPSVIETIRRTSTSEEEFRIIVSQAYALDALCRGWSLDEALENLGTPVRVDADAVSDIYRNFGSLHDNRQHPSREIQYRAESILGRIRVSLR